jgi:hypothetical protein
MSKLEIVNPVARAEAEEPLAERFAPAKRPATLAGETIGLFWNGKPQGDVGLARAREQLVSVFEGVRFLDVFGEKGGLNRYASPAQIEQMVSECAAVVAATAD